MAVPQESPCLSSRDAPFCSSVCRLVEFVGLVPVTDLLFILGFCVFIGHHLGGSHFIPSLFSRLLFHPTPTAAQHQARVIEATPLVSDQSLLAGSTPSSKAILTDQCGLWCQSDSKKLNPLPPCALPKPRTIEQDHVGVATSIVTWYKSLTYEKCHDSQKANRACTRGFSVKFRRGNTRVTSKIAMR